MAFFDLFGSKDKSAKLNHLKNLWCLALSDGKLAQSEIMTIKAVMERDGINSKELERIMKNPNSVSYVVPSNDNERRMYMKDLIFLMMSDGHIAEEEKEVCKLAAISYGYKPEIVDNLIEVLILEVAANVLKSSR
jgi:uncharacterized tellurite resistance protein B-like protein